MEILHRIQDYKTAADLENDPGLALMQDEDDIRSLKEYYGQAYGEDLDRYGFFYVDTSDGDYKRVYGSLCSGMPYLSAGVERLKTPSEILNEAMAAVRGKRR